MAVAFQPINFNVALYFVENERQNNVESLLEHGGGMFQRWVSTIQVKCTRSETVASVIYRVTSYIKNANGFVAAATRIDKVFYNFKELSYSAATEIGSAITDPLCTTIILCGNVTLVNCCCLSSSIINCLVPDVKPEVFL